MHRRILLFAALTGGWFSAAAFSAEPQAAPKSPVPSAGPGTPATPPPVAATPDQLPYVYTKWKHFTVEDGLPNDHIFAVKADGNRVWVGTDDGLALIDKKAGQSRPRVEGERRAAVASRHGDRGGSEDRRRVAGAVRPRAGPPERRTLRPFPPAQQRPGERRRLRDRHGKRQRLGGNDRRLQPLQHEDQGVGGIHREERSHGGNLELQRRLQQGDRQNSHRRVGQRRAGIRLQKGPGTAGRSLEGLPGPRRRDGNRPVPRRRDHPRDYDRSQPGGRRVLGLVVLRLLPL